jgi:4-hydroxybenzoate polyprenyltransferase
MNIHTRLLNYCYLMRLNKPIGILLLLWPTLWALWLASGGRPPGKILFIFVAGVIIMRSAGCIINDYADRNIDPYVARTKDRPLASAKVSTKEALLLFVVLLATAFSLVLMCNRQTIMLSFVAAALAIIYPFLKRITYFPQGGLGLAFSFGIPMAFAAIKGEVPANAWVLFAAACLWPMIYDTMYAMVDKADDCVIGVKSTAILFATWDRLIIAMLQLAMVAALAMVGRLFSLTYYYYVCLLLVAILFCYQQWLIKDGKPSDYFKAFLHNNWQGMLIFSGIFLSYSL